jgi:hypothetical protein
MLTVEEIQMLESLLRRARLAISAALNPPLTEAIGPGNLVQLRPGADPQWETSFLSVAKVRDDGGIAGTILRPHRGGWRDAWYTYRSPDVFRIGRAPYPEPSAGVQSAGYWPPCPSCHNIERKPVGRETRQGTKVAK